MSTTRPRQRARVLPMQPLARTPARIHGIGIQFHQTADHKRTIIPTIGRSHRRHQSTRVEARCLRIDTRRHRATAHQVTTIPAVLASTSST
jgi:hypothetical protein